MTARDKVTDAVGEIVGLLSTEFSALAPEFRARAEELKEAAITNANAVLDGSITLAQAEENLQLLTAALQSELLVAGFRAKAKSVALISDAAGIALKLAVGLLAA